MTAWQIGVADLVPGFEFTYGQLFAALIIIGIGVIVARLIGLVLQRGLKPTVSAPTVRIASRLVYYAVTIIAVLAGLSVLEVPLGSLLVAGGFLGIVLGFATQSVIANWFSGIFLQIDRPIQIGDPVDFPDLGIAGEVMDITVFSTRVRTWDGMHVRIPNDKVFTATIKNLSRHVARRVEAQVSIGYHEKPDRAIEVIKEKLNAEPLILADPAPIVFVDTLADSGVVLNVFAWAPAKAFFPARVVAVQRIKEALDEAGIEIPFPQRVVRLEGTLPSS
jgi:small-conductance mechanosensitive channel